MFLFVLTGNKYDDDDDNRWNRLPSDVVTVKSINSFKAGLQRVRDTQIDFFMDK